MTLTSLSRRHVILGIVECRKYAACTQTSERFEPNAVLWAFHTISVSYTHLTLPTILRV